MDASEREQYRAAIQGDREAFEMIIRTNSRALFAIAYGILQDRGEAEDVVQDSLVKAWKTRWRLRDPEKFPALKAMDVIVELHDHPQFKCSEIVPRRFGPTHKITLVNRVPRGVTLPKMLDRLGDLDRLLAIWEWRAGPTPWAVMTAK